MATRGSKPARCHPQVNPPDPAKRSKTSVRSGSVLIGMQEMGWDKDFTSQEGTLAAAGFQACDELVRRSARWALVSLGMRSALVLSGDATTADLQGSFLLARLPRVADASVLSGVDLFAGIGGMSAGFAELGIPMEGIDAESIAGTVYRAAGFGASRVADLRAELIQSDASIVVGGPPCRPWSGRQPFFSGAPRTTLITAFSGGSSITLS